MRSELMGQLRVEFDARGIAWEAYPWVSVADGFFMDRTRFAVGGVEFSVIWGYQEYPGGAYGITEGWPSELECWCRERWDEPFAMDVCEILAIVDREASRA